MTGLLAGIITFAIWGLLPGLSVLAVAGLLVLLLTVKDKHGQSIVDRFATRMNFRLARSGGTNLYRSGPLGVTEWGMFQLPGLAAKSRLYEFNDSYNRPFACCTYPPRTTSPWSSPPNLTGRPWWTRNRSTRGSRTGAAGSPDSGMKPGLEAAAVTVETAPDSGYRLRNEVEMNIDPDAPAAAKAILREVVRTVPGRLGHRPGLGVPDVHRRAALRIAEARHPKTSPGTWPPASRARCPAAGHRRRHRPADVRAGTLRGRPDRLRPARGLDH